MMKTTSDDIALRFPDPEVMKKWLFNFQKSVALVLLRIFDASLFNVDKRAAGADNRSKAARRHNDTGHGRATGVGKRRECLRPAALAQ